MCQSSRRWKVLALPTTVILIEAGQVADINYGLASRKKLEGQLANAGSCQSGPALEGQ
jgi:hypothetical protein